MKIDRGNRILLRALQQNARRTHQQLGQLAHMSPSTVRRRIDSLRASGVIRREVALIDPSALGASVQVLSLVAFARESTRVYREFKRRMLGDAAVLHCYSISGEYDFALLVSATDPAAYERWSQKTLLSDSNIKRYNSFVVWSTVKDEVQSLVEP